VVCKNCNLTVKISPCPTSTSFAKLHSNEGLYDNATENKTYLICQASPKRRTCRTYLPLSHIQILNCFFGNATTSYFRRSCPIEKSAEYVRMQGNLRLRYVRKIYRRYTWIFHVWRLSMSSSFCPHRTTRFHLDRFSWNFVTVIFLKFMDQIRLCFNSGENKKHFI
jgi:hypothetical protein